MNAMTHSDTLRTAVDCNYMLLTSDALHFLRSQPASSVDFVLTSPPYEDARTYGLTDPESALKGQDWVDWILPIFEECLRVSKGLVAFVVDGRTRKGKYSLTPERLAIALSEAGYTVPRPAYFHRYGVPGKSNWLRPVSETIVCASNTWPLPYANFKSGNPPKYDNGGGFSNRQQDGTRVEGRPYPKVKKTWRTNVFSGKVGKGHMGDDLAHSNEAPFPEWLVKDWLEVFCPPDGVVLDPFCGSGTTVAVARKLGMRGIGVDARSSQISIACKRMEGITNDES